MLVIVFLPLLASCMNASNTKGNFRANVQDNRQLERLASDMPENYFEIELSKEKEKLKTLIKQSQHPNEVKQEGLQFIETFDFSRIKTMQDFMDIFLIQLMEILPDGSKETLDIAIASTIIAASTPVSEADSKRVKVKQDFLKQAIKKTAVQKGIKETDIKISIAEAAQESGYWADSNNIQSAISQISDEILNEPEVIDVLSQKAIKLTMEGCIDPDLTRIPTDQNLTLCDGSQATGMFVIPALTPNCDAEVNTDCVVTKEVAIIEKVSCTDPDLNQIPSTQQVILCDGSTADGRYVIPVECSSGGEVGCVTINSFPSMDRSSTDIDATENLSPINFNGLLQSDTSFQYWDKFGNRLIGVGNSDLTQANVKSSIELFGIEGGYGGSPDIPTGVSTARGSSTQMDLVWDDAEVTGYLLVVTEGAVNNFLPSNGETYTSGSSISGVRVVYSGSLASASNTLVTEGNTYHYRLFAYDDFKNYSKPIVFSKFHSLCSYLQSGTWVSVPGNPTYSTQDFCVMKYEAKRTPDSGPESRAADVPWINIDLTNSLSQCQSLGTGYDLISNDQWMTLAVNIESVDSNWSGNSVGNGHLNRGNSDVTSGRPCRASIDESLAYVSGNQNCLPKASDGESNPTIQKRNHTLSNNEVIWDLAGNAWEWVNLSSISSKPYDYGGFVEYTSTNLNYAGASIQENRLISQAAISGSWNSTQGIGKIWPGPDGTPNRLIRGGNWQSGTVAGLFAASLRYTVGTNNQAIGFRCVYVAP